MTDRIEKTIELKAPVERVWRALSDPAEFGAWFRVELDGPFRAGEVTRGRLTVPGYEHVEWETTTVAVEPPRRLAFHWRPYAVDPKIDYSQEEPTLVEFRLEPLAAGTRLTVTESGFERVPAWRRDEALRMNDRGWQAQMREIEAHVDG